MSSESSPPTPASPVEGSEAADGRPDRQVESRLPLWRRSLPWVILFAVAFSVRLGTLAELSRVDPFFSAPVVDELTNYRDAQAILDHGWPETPFWKPPLYPYFIALTLLPDPPSSHDALYSDDGPSFWPLKILQSMLDSLTALLIVAIGYRIVRRDRDSSARHSESTQAGPKLQSRVPWVAGAIYAFSFTPVYYAAQILDTTLFVFLCVTAVYSALKAWETDDAMGWCIAGLVVGLAALARAPALLYLPIVGLLPVWQQFLLSQERKRADSSVSPPRWARSVVFGTIVLFGAGAALAPCALLNYRVGNDRVLISSNGGVNFYIGNRQGGGLGADGMTSVVAGPRWREVLAQVDDAAKPSAKSRQYYQLALEEIGEAPGAFLRRLIEKSFALIDGYEIPNNKNFVEERSRSVAYRWLPGRTGVVFALALAGLLFGYRAFRHRWIAFGFVASQAVAIVGFFVAARYRVPILALMTIPAALTLVQLTLGWRDARQRARQLSIAAVTIGLLVLLHADPLGHRMRYREYVVDAMQLGYVYERQSEVAAKNALSDGQIAEDERLGVVELRRKALNYYELALRLDPDYPEAEHNIAHLELGDGVRRQAEDRLRRMLVTNAWFAEGWNTLGQSLTQPPTGATGNTAARFEEAANAFKSALAADPTYSKAHANLGQLLEAQGYTTDARDSYQLARKYALAQTPPPPDTALFYLLEIQLLWKTGRSPIALGLFDDLLRSGLRPRSDHQSFYDRIYDNLATYPDGPPTQSSEPEPGPDDPRPIAPLSDFGPPPATPPDSASKPDMERVFVTVPLPGGQGFSDGREVGFRQTIEMERGGEQIAVEYYFNPTFEPVGVFLPTGEGYLHDEDGTLLSIGIASRSDALGHFYRAEGRYEFKKR